MKVPHRHRMRALGGVLLAGALTVALAPTSAAAPAATPTQPYGSISGSTAQALNADVAGLLDLALSDPATSASNDGNDPNDLVQGNPDVTALDGLSILQVGALKEAAQADEHGSAFSCAGVVSPTGTIHIGSGPDGPTCTVQGNGTGGLTIDLSELSSQLPGGGGLLASLADVKVTADAITAHAYQNVHGEPVLGATLADLHVHVVVLGVLDLNVPISLGTSADGTLEPNQNVLTAVVNALTDKLGDLGAILKAVLIPIIDALSNTLSGVISLQANYQPAASPGTVSALHIGVLGSTASIDLATATVGVGCTKKPFDDVAIDNPFCVAITWSKKNLVTYGSSPTDHNYSPTEVVSRGQFAAFLHRLVAEGTAAAPCTSGPRPFPDVRLGNVFCQDIRWLKNSDISEGFDSGNFNIGGSLTRQNIAAQLYRLAHGGTHAPGCGPSDQPFPDVDQSTNFCGAIKWLAEQGISQGDTSGNFNPTQDITRQSMAGFLSQYDRAVMG